MLVSSLLGLLACSPSLLVEAVELDVDDASSIKDAVSKLAYNTISYYSGNETGDNPGNVPDPYYWWEGGAMFGEMVNYWYYTGDDSNNPAVTQALLSQIGADEDFMPRNQTKSLGNDDQVFWAFSALNAAEYNYPPPEGDNPSWLALAQAVFNEQTERWDTSTCGGGLRWQVFTFNAGYEYKNSVSNLGLFQLSARLARYTGNDTYVDWAEKTWDWFSGSILFDNDGYRVFDGASDTLNCTEADHTQWTYNYGSAIAGLAYIYNATENEKWLDPLDGLLNTTFRSFFPESMGDKIMVEVACQPIGNCNEDQLSFRSYLARWLAVTTQLVPALADRIWPYLIASAEGAAAQCTGGANNQLCGAEWNSTTWDGTQGMGEAMSALAVVQSMMLRVDKDLKPPYTLDTGGKSESNPDAGTDHKEDPTRLEIPKEVTTGDKAGAGILTAIVLITILGGSYWIVT
ncbi:hypothetical protein MBLNU230_g4590t1 [Neophaeotheca triangularis]